MAPQVQEGNSYNSKCDVWSFGVLLYEMLFKKHPWFNTERDRLLQAIRTQPLTFPFNSPSQQLMRIIERCLIYDEDSRIGWN
jgi:serine/threonine protein kinase